MTNAISRLPEVLRDCGKARSTLYAEIQRGVFTKPVRLGAKAVGWPVREVEAINAARIAGKGEREIRALVAELESARGGAA